MFSFPRDRSATDQGPESSDPVAGGAPGRTNRTTLWNAASTAVVWAAGAAVFFRAQLASGFARNMGDDGDARLIVFLCEHWYLLFRGQGTWRNLGFFFPVKGLLGWSDSFFLYEIFYTPLRLVGCDPFLAFQITLVLLSAVGFVSFVILVRQAFGASQPLALIGGVLFTFSNTLWLHVSSPQLLGIYFVPFILLLALAAGRALPVQPRRSAILAAIAGLTYALLLYTTYYVAWFAMLALIVVTLCSVALGRRAFIVGALSSVRRAWRTLVAAGAAFAVGIVPFVLTYFPVLSQFGGVRYGQAMVYAPRWEGLADVGPGNLLWSGLLYRIEARRFLKPYELTFAVTPVLFTLAILSALAVAWRLRRGTATHPVAARSSVILAGTAVILSVLPVRTRRYGSLWAVVWHLPGASAIRAIDRLQVVTGLIVTLAVVAAATELSSRRRDRGQEPVDRQPRRSRWLRLAGAGLLLVAVVEQYNTTDRSLVSRPAQLTLLRSATAPPRGCRSFYVIDTSRRVRLPPYGYQIDAMLVSQKLSIPTLNGYTAHNPPGWGLKSPLKSRYLTQVVAWADAHDIRAGLCQLNLATMRWDANPALPDPRRNGPKRTQIS